MYMFSLYMKISFLYSFLLDIFDEYALSTALNEARSFDADSFYWNQTV